MIFEYKVGMDLGMDAKCALEDVLKKFKLTLETKQVEAILHFHDSAQ